MFTVKKILISFLILFIVTVSAFAEWRIDAKGEGLPYNFRTMKDPWHIAVTGNAPSREKMASLRISASAQPAEKEFFPLAERLRQLAKSGAIYVVDLRQETHGFADGYGVYFYEKKNLGNFGMKTPEVIAAENNEINLLLGKQTEFVLSGKNGTAKGGIVTLTPKSVKTEAMATKAAGLRYARFACPDQKWIGDSNVDDFMRFVNALPKNSWLHFHCLAGHGRTTTFLVISEILANPKIPLETIVKRQYLLGGSDLLADVEGDTKKDRDKHHRADMIRKFYKYANELDDGKTALSWSEWVKNN